MRTAGLRKNCGRFRHWSSLFSWLTPVVGGRADLITCAVGGRGDPCTQWERRKMARTPFCELFTGGISRCACPMRLVQNSCLSLPNIAKWRPRHFAGAGPCPAAHRGGDLIRLAAILAGVAAWEAVEKCLREHWFLLFGLLEGRRIFNVISHDQEESAQ
jgi:hypothetical protein